LGFGAGGYRSKPSSWQKVKPGGNGAANNVRPVAFCRWRPRCRDPAAALVFRHFFVMAVQVRSTATPAPDGLRRKAAIASIDRVSDAGLLKLLLRLIDGMNEPFRPLTGLASPV
jgi:hypothetical protein